MATEQLVSKAWNYVHVLRDRGISCGDYVERITCLLFLQMDAEREEPPGETSAIAPPWRWGQLANQNAFAGKLVPQDTADKPAAELLARIRASRAAQPEKTTRSSA
jgi:hypothetical protein